MSAKRASATCSIGAAASAAEHNGVEGVSHIKDKLVEMTHLNETIYSSCMAGAHHAKPLASGAYINDAMLSNVAKHNVTRFPTRSHDSLRTSPAAWSSPCLRRRICRTTKSDR